MKSFAKRAKSIQKKYKNYKASKIEEESMMDELQLLANEQEAVKAQMSQGRPQGRQVGGSQTSPNIMSMGGLTDGYLNMYADGGKTGDPTEELSNTVTAGEAVKNVNTGWTSENIQQLLDDKTSVSPSFSGEDILNAANTLNFPVELFLAQAFLEGNFGTKGAGKATNNPFNVGNTTKGDNLPRREAFEKGYRKTYPTTEAGLMVYMDLIQRRYMKPNGSYDHLVLGEEGFVNDKGYGYAEDKKGYSKSVLAKIKTFKKYNPEVYIPGESGERPVALPSRDNRPIKDISKNKLYKPLTTEEALERGDAIGLWDSDGNATNNYTASEIIRDEEGDIIREEDGSIKNVTVTERKDFEEIGEDPLEADSTEYDKAKDDKAKEEAALRAEQERAANGIGPNAPIDVSGLNFPDPGVEDNMYGGVDQTTIEDNVDALGDKELFSKEEYDRRIDKMSKRLTYAYQSLKEAEDKKADFESKPYYDRQAGLLEPFDWMEGDDVYNFRNRPSKIQENIKKLEGELETYKILRDKSSPRKKDKGYDFEQEIADAEKADDKRAKEETIEAEKKAIELGDFNIDDYAEEDYLSMTDAFGIPKVQDYTEVDPEFDAEAEVDEKLPTKEEKEDGWLKNNANLIATGLGGVAPIISNISNLRNLEDPDIVNPSLAKTSLKSSFYDPTAMEGILSNQLASARTELSAKGGNTEEYVSALRKINQDNAMAQGLAQIEGQKMNIQEQGRLDKAVTDVNIINSARTTQAGIDQAQRQDFIDSQRRGYVSAIGENVGGIFGDIGDALLAEKLAPLMGREKTLTNTLQNK